MSTSSTGSTTGAPTGRPATTRRAPSTERGTAKRKAIIDAAEQVFAELGYTDASVSRITDRAGCAQGTFYLYFDSKLAVFEELVEDLNRRVRHAMTEAAAGATTRMEGERAGFRAFFAFTAEHPALYRVVREAEFVSPRALRQHYTRIVEGYVANLTKARADGDVGDIDPTVAAWCLMGIGEMIGMRWVLWGSDEPDPDLPDQPVTPAAVPDHVLDEVMALVERALDARPRPTDAAPTDHASIHQAPTDQAPTDQAPTPEKEPPA
ncbi:TetR/AcrR family transcriptional regulator [Nocardioides bruguierae]|uniref:TetR/AcrR family transcriptional regulator n=1 Tax=Nocardioides bruguierae TaxID=2945102 RepID=UPI00202174B7|nr:TetR/AcrR family transcriptional regulator [Nocardioides bruguierae]MCL8025903.1 TetR/AcrR family transcriptional regulator [Nocardioides bruguierae]